MRMYDKVIDLSSKLRVNKRISEIKKELFRQSLDSAKNFSYSWIFFSEVKALTSEPLQAMSATAYLR